LTIRDHEYPSKIIQLCRAEKLKARGKIWNIKQRKIAFIKSKKNIVPGMSRRRPVLSSGWCYCNILKE